MGSMGIVSFTVEAKTYKFKEPLMLKVEYIEGGVCLTHKDLSLSACGGSFSECDAIIREELELLWEEYAMAPDKDLTASAIVLKNKLLAMMGELSEEKIKEIKAMEKQVIERITEPERWLE